jgi:uncharacterized protein with beta-barrel porin domain
MITVGAGGIGINAQGDNSTILNSGAIVAGDNGTGIQVGDPSTVVNSGTIAVGVGGVGISGGSDTTVTNSGTVTVVATGIGITSSGNILNTGTVNVGNFAIGIAAQGNATVTNSGTVTVGAFGAGISGSANVLNTGTISVAGGSTGIATLGGNAAVTNSGTISVGGLGSGIVSDSNIFNSGTINVGTGSAGIIALGANATVVNNNAINTCGVGILAIGGSAITNSGSIAASGCNAIGVSLGQGGTLANSGTITASTTLAMTLGGNATVTNSGILNGAVALGGTGGNTLVNAGLITVGAPLTAGGGVAHFVNGTFTQTASGVFTTRISPNNAPGNYDTLQVGGTVPGTGVANLGGTLRPLVQPGLYGTSTTYAGVLTFSSSTGSFAALSPLSLFLNTALVYNPTSVDLVITRTPFNQFPGGGANARAVGNMLEGNYATSLTGPLAAFYTQLLQSTAPNTLSQLTGEVATTSQNASFTMFGQFLGTIFGQTGSARALGGAAALPAASQTAQRTAGGGTSVAVGSAAEPCASDACDVSTAPPRYRAWAQGFGSSYSIDRNLSVGNSRVDMNAGGGATGIDLWLGPNALVGFTMGTTSAGYSLTDLLSSGSARSIVLGLYGGYTQGPAYVDGALGYGYATFTTNRFIGTGSLSEIANGAFDGYQYGGRVEGGWRFSFDKNVLTPFGGLTVQALTQSGYSESSRTAATGAPGVLGVTVQGQTSTSVRSTFGGQFETAIMATDDAILRPRLRVGWAHEFNTNRTATVTLGSLLPNAPFQVTGAQPAPDALIVSAGFDLELTHMVRLYGQFDSDLSYNARAFAGTGGLRLVW